ncbi:MAG: aminodeoxychorismate synthase component I [Deltaproteobacteria bacterium]|jgi:para-aminobenzoate synthetase component 1|nr:aminodeoxychorismate synthase component I [Deltaproteobacteria bacterium]
MEYQEPAVIFEEMNRLGSRGEPFLFAVDFELQQGFLVPDPQEQREVFYEFLGEGNKDRSAVPAASEVTLRSSPMSLKEYAGMFEVVRRGLARGDSYLVNLTAATEICCSLPLAEIFRRSTAPWQLYVPGRFVCFSPERFVRIKDGQISTCPMKGTIKAEIPNAAEIILNDPKETAEHATIVDLLRNDLSLSARKVHVSRYRYIDRIRTRQREILQVSSEIAGTLPGDWRSRLGGIIGRMLPAGSCSGAPKESTVDIIRRAELGPRGFYTGVSGLFDGQNFDSAVLIRFIEEKDGQMFFRSGGGITAQSSLESEYLELLDKIYLPFA